MPPVKDESIRETNCLEIINIVEKSPGKSTLVDVRACNKPAAKVRNNLSMYFIVIFYKKAFPWQNYRSRFLVRWVSLRALNGISRSKFDLVTSSSFVLLNEQINISNVNYSFTLYTCRNKYYMHE